MATQKRLLVRISLICGIASSLLYVAMNVFVPMQWEGYSSASQTVSELSAIGAPTRSTMGAAGHRLQPTCGRLRMGRPAIGRSDSHPARRGMVDRRQRTPRTRLATDASA